MGEVVSATERIAELEAQVALLLAEVRRLKQENAELKEKLNKSSRNSSRPPSSDGPKDKHERPSKAATGRAPGGQPGHPKHERVDVPPGKVSQRIVLVPKRCGRCFSALSGHNEDQNLYLVFALPKLELT